MASALISTLQSIRRAIDAHMPVSPFEAKHLAQAVDLLNQNGSSRLLPPPDARLEDLHKRVCMALDADLAELPLSNEDWLDAPWIATREWRACWLCAAPAFVNGLRKAALQLPSLSRKCAQVYLRDFDPRRREELEPLAAILQAQADGDAGSFAFWAALHHRFQLFAGAPGPALAVAALLARDNDATLFERLPEAGLKGELYGGGFSAVMLLQWCARAHSRPQEELEAIEKWMEACAGPLAGKEETVVAALLDPWLEQDPSPDWRRALLKWLMGRYQDPRMRANAFWARLPTHRCVPERWLALATIEGFFDELDQFAKRIQDHAMLRQWPYRRAFWLAYYRRGLILEAKTAAGTALETQRGWGALKERFGFGLARAQNFAPNQSALVLRMKDFVVFVGTHNARCRLWKDDSPHAPKLGSTVFSKRTVITDPRTDLKLDDSQDTGLVQAGSENLTWQRKLRDFFHHHLSVYVPDHELMP